VIVGAGFAGATCARELGEWPFPSAQKEIL